MAICLASIISATISLQRIMVSIWCCTLRRLIFSTKSAFLELRSSGLVMVFSCLIAGLMRLIISPICPSLKSSQAAFTAPHEVCPITTINFAPKYLVLNSKLPIALSEAIFPAKRTLKTSPSAWSNTSSTGARESLQLRKEANGCCLSFVI